MVMKLTFAGAQAVSSLYLLLAWPLVVPIHSASASQDVKLVGGSSKYSGRLVMRYGSLWSAVCPGQTWGIVNGLIVCRQLGFGRLQSTGSVTSAYAGDPSDPVMYTDVHCDGDERSLKDCQLSFSASCLYTEVVMVTCAEADDNPTTAVPRTTSPTNTPTARTSSAVIATSKEADDNPTTAVPRTTSPTNTPTARTSSAVIATSKGNTREHSSSAQPGELDFDIKTIFIPTRPTFANEIAGERAILDAFIDLDMTHSLEAQERLHTPLVGPMFLSTWSEKRKSKPVFLHRCWVSQSRVHGEPHKQRDVIINSCEAPNFLAVVRRAGPRRGDMGGFTFGFGAVQLKEFAGSQFWVHCKASVCNDSLHCYPRCTPQLRKQSFEPSHSSGRPAVLFATTGPFQLEVTHEYLTGRGSPETAPPNGLQGKAAGAALQPKRFSVTLPVLILLISCSVLIFMTAVCITWSLRRRRPQTVHIINVVGKQSLPSVTTVPLSSASTGKVSSKTGYLGTRL